jgi:hypothetical protein
LLSEEWPLFVVLQMHMQSTEGNKSFYLCKTI